MQCKLAPAAAGAAAAVLLEILQQIKNIFKLLLQQGTGFSL
jgi:hypothetical protein